MHQKPGLFLIMLLLPVSSAFAGEVSVAVAANFVRPMEILAEAFEKQSGHTVVISPGSSGRLYAQIVNGAPYDLFLSADQEKPTALVDKGLAVAGSRFTYAMGTLVVWWRGGDGDPEDALKEGKIRRLAMANPRLAPYGRAAEETLEALGLTETYQGRLVRGENINQAFQFVRSGNVDAGFIARSQIVSDNGEVAGMIWEVPKALHSPIRQDAVLLKPAREDPPSQELLEFIKSPSAKKIINEFGYGTD